MMRWQATRAMPSLALMAMLLAGAESSVAKAPEKTANSSTSAKPDKPVDPSQLPPLEQPLILVNGMVINSQDYLNFLQMNPAVISMAASSEIGKTEALREMVRVYLLRKAMYDQGFLQRDQKQPTPNEVSAAYEKLAKAHFPRPTAPDDKAAYEYYKSHANKYGIPGNYRFNQILFKTPHNPEPQILKAAQERADAALKRLNAGETFSQVATELTDNKLGKLTGGDIGYLNPVENTWLEEPLKTLKVGERVGPIMSPEGLVILELTDSRPALISPFANVREKVIKDLVDEQQKKIRDDYVLELAKSAKIEVVGPSIKTLFPNGVLP